MPGMELRTCRPAPLPLPPPLGVLSWLRRETAADWERGLLLLLLLLPLLLLLLLESSDRGPVVEKKEKKVVGVVVLTGRERARAVVEGVARPSADRKACRFIVGFCFPHLWGVCWFVMTVCVESVPLRERGARGSLSARPSVRLSVARSGDDLRVWTFGTKLENGCGSEVENVSGVVVGQLCFRWGRNQDPGFFGSRP